ncbi:hypothetical protein [Vibrio phage phiKT1024]|nr:hypothetical protein [Vibrio phage phiKT1024]
MDQEPYEYIYYDGRIYEKSWASNRNWIERAEDLRNGRWSVFEHQDCLIYHDDDIVINNMGQSSCRGVRAEFGELKFLTESEMKEFIKDHPELFI